MEESPHSRCSGRSRGLERPPFDPAVVYLYTLLASSFRPQEGRRRRIGTPYRGPYPASVLAERSSRSSGEETRVDHQLSAGDVPRAIRGEEEDGFDDVAGLDPRHVEQVARGAFGDLLRREPF